MGFAREARGLCVDALCRDDGDLLCEYLCAVLGDKDGLSMTKQIHKYEKDMKLLARLEKQNSLKEDLKTN